MEDLIFIPASPARVWDLTCDVAAWPRFVPTMSSLTLLDGELREGARVRIKQPLQPAAVWTVTRFVPGSVLEWSTGSRLVLVGRHEVLPAPGGCRCRLTLTVSGQGSWLFRVLLGPVLRYALWAENRGFRRAAVAG